MNMSFHYNIDVDFDRRIVIAKIYGIWKDDTARDYHNDYMEAVEPLLKKKGAWAKLTNLSNWKSSYPEIIEILGEHMTWCHEKGAEHSVYVIDNPVTMRQLKAMIDNSNLGKSAKFFGTLKEAEKFLAQQGFK